MVILFKKHKRIDQILYDEKENESKVSFIIIRAPNSTNMSSMRSPGLVAFLGDITVFLMKYEEYYLCTFLWRNALGILIS